MNKNIETQMAAPPPEQVLGQMIGGFFLTQAIHVAARLRVPDLVENQARSATDLAGELGQSEIGDLRTTSPVDHYVRGLEIPVEDALGVSRGQARA